MDGSDIKVSFEVHTIMGITDMEAVIGEELLCKLKFREQNCWTVSVAVPVCHKREITVV